MRDILIIGASGGIGSALSAEYTEKGTRVTKLARATHGFDITDQSCVETMLGGLGPFDVVIVATGALEIAGAAPEKTIRKLEAQAMADQLALNAIGPALALKHAATLLPRDRPSVFAALSARVGSIGDNHLGGWISYRAAKAALNQIVRTAAIELKRSHPQAVLVALHPGTVATDFTAKYLGRHPAVPPAEAARNLTQVIDTLIPAQSGGFFDYSGKAVPW